MTTSSTKSSARSSTNGAAKQWLTAAGLVALTLVPMAAGAVRLGQLGSGAAATPENARFVATPFPVVVHIVSASVFCLVGAFQFVPVLRRRRPGWHRVAGRVLVPLGIATAVSGLWMSVYYPSPPGDCRLLEVFRLGFGSAMVLSLVLGTAAVLCGDLRRHRAWMMRGYAIGLGAGTQVFTHLPWLLLVGKPEGVARALLMAAGWVINLGVAEWSIRRRVAPTRVASARALTGSGKSR